MKKSEVSVESLKAMGYKAVYVYNSWTIDKQYDANDKASDSVFNAIVEAVRYGENIDIWRVPKDHTVRVSLKRLLTRCSSFSSRWELVREMTARETEAI